MSRTTLPPAPWRADPRLRRIVAALGEARVVGGAVRDTLLGLAVADVDCATPLPPAEVVVRLEAAGVRAVPTGIAHGTVTAVADGLAVEVTTLRRDLSTDGRHATIGFTDDWREDAARRDFTMNALYADVDTGAVYDWFGGLGDLAERRVRFIGDPLTRIAEDHLRILRFFRFHARFGEAIDADGLAACTARANDLMALSRERIAAELLKLLVAPAAVATVATMYDCGIFRPILPVDADGVARLAAVAAREAAAGVPPDAVRRLAALVGHEAAAGVGARLKLSKADRQRLETAGAGTGTEGGRALAYRVGPASAIDRLLLAGETPDTILGWSLPSMPLTGGALVARGLDRGPDVARTLKAIETAWIAEGFPGPERVGEIADGAVAQALRARKA